MHSVPSSRLLQHLEALFPGSRFAPRLYTAMLASTESAHRGNVVKGWMQRESGVTDFVVEAEIRGRPTGAG